MKQQNQQQTQPEIQEEIPQELISKFDGDKQLVERFISNGYTIEQLQNSQITHPSPTDPAVVLNGKTIGFWLP